MFVNGLQLYFQFPVYGLGSTVVVILFQIDPFKMHGGEDSIHFLHFCPGHEIDTPDIFIFMAGIKPGIQVIIYILFELVIIFLGDPAETNLNKTVMHQFIYIFRQVQEGGDTVQVFHNCRPLCLQVIAFRIDVRELLAEGVNKISGFIQGNIPDWHVLCILQQPCKFCGLVQDLLIRVDLNIGGQVLHLRQLCHGIFQMDLIFSQVFVDYSVNVRLRTGNAQEFHFLNHVNYLRG